MRYSNIRSTVKTHYTRRRKTSFSIDKLIYNIRPTLNQLRSEMNSYNELKAEMEATQQKIVEAKKNECANALKEVNA